LTVVRQVPLTKYGWPQVVVFPAVVLVVMGVFLLVWRTLLPAWAIVSIETLLVTILILILTFFRDPNRATPADKNVLLSPADGRITDIEVVKKEATEATENTENINKKSDFGELSRAVKSVGKNKKNIEEDNFIGGAALRIGIFLSIFDAHINRAPCNVKVENITYKKGAYKNAKKPHSGRVNESNDLYLVRTDSPEDKLIVRQISGAIARRIVCDTRIGQKLAGGEKFGMIKFGSRTELYVQHAIRNTQYEIKCLVKIGDKVKAGLTPLVKYEIRDPSLVTRDPSDERPATRNERCPD